MCRNRWCVREHSQICALCTVCVCDIDFSLFYAYMARFAWCEEAYFPVLSLLMFENDASYASLSEDCPEHERKKHNVCDLRDETTILPRLIYNALSTHFVLRKHPISEKTMILSLT